MNYERGNWFLHAGRTWPVNHYVKRPWWFYVRPRLDVYAGRQFFTFYVRLFVYSLWISYDKRCALP